MQIFRLRRGEIYGNRYLKMNVIYDKETRRVVITEMDGVWTMPNSLDIKEYPLEADVFVDKDGDLYLKAEQVN